MCNKLHRKELSGLVNQLFSFTISTTKNRFFNVFYLILLFTFTQKVEKKHFLVSIYIYSFSSANIQKLFLQQIYIFIFVLIMS